MEKHTSNPEGPAVKPSKEPFSSWFETLNPKTQVQRTLRQMSEAVGMEAHFDPNLDSFGI